MTAAAVSRVLHTGISVSDMDRALYLFRDVLGFTATEPKLYDAPVFERITGMPGAQIVISYVETPNHRLELLQYLSPQGGSPSTLRPCDPGHIHLALEVTDLPVALSRLEEAGFAAAGPLQRDGQPDTLAAIYATGPDGLYLELIQRS